MNAGEKKNKIRRNIYALTLLGAFRVRNYYIFIWQNRKLNLLLQLTLLLDKLDILANHNHNVASIAAAHTKTQKKYT